MGVLTDLVCATESELAALGENEIPIDVFPGLDIKGTGLIELGTLSAIVRGVKFDPAMKEFPCVLGQDTQEGPWILKFPEALLSRLSGAATKDLRAYAAEWVKTEEMTAAGWTIEEAESRLSEIASFARSVSGLGKPVHIWMCV